jgi:hypothetical protein
MVSDQGRTLYSDGRSVTDGIDHNWHGAGGTSYRKMQNLPSSLLRGRGTTTKVQRQAGHFSYMGPSKQQDDTEQIWRPFCSRMYGNNQDWERQVMIHNALELVPETEPGIEVTKFLVERMKVRSHESLLHSTVMGGNWTFAEALISIGVDVNTPRESIPRDIPPFCLLGMVQR